MALDQDIAVSDLTAKAYADILSGDYLMGIATAEAYKATVTNVATRMALDIFDGRYLNADGGTVTGNLYIQNTSPQLLPRSTKIDAAVGEVTGLSSGENNIGGIQVGDKNNFNVGWLRWVKHSNDNVYANLTIRRTVNDEVKGHHLYLGVKPDGTNYVDVSDASIWRKALELNADSSWGSDKIATYKKQGNVVTVTYSGTSTDVQIPVSTWTTLATLPTGYRPSKNIYTAAMFTGGKLGAIRIGSAGIVAGYVNSSMGAIASGSVVYFNTSFVI